MDTYLEGSIWQDPSFFKGMLEHLCHSDPNLMSKSTLKSLGPIAKTVTAKETNCSRCQNKGEHFS
jgi:hypothetical protein